MDHKTPFTDPPLYILQWQDKPTAGVMLGNQVVGFLSVALPSDGKAFCGGGGTAILILAAEPSGGACSSFRPWAKTH